MIKATAKLKDENLVVLGLSDANVRELRRHRPILFNLTELGLEDRPVCISYKSKDRLAALPAGFQGIALIVSDSLLDWLSSACFVARTSSRWSRCWLDSSAQKPSWRAAALRPVICRRGETNP